MDIDRIRHYVQHKVITRENTPELKESDDWLANGLVDSIGVVQIVSFVERELNTPVPEEDVTVENFRSLKDVAHYLERRKNTRSAIAE